MVLKLLSPLIVFLMFTFTAQPVFTQDACPVAPNPQLVVGQQGNVTAGPPNNVRDLPSRDGELIGEIPGADVFVVLEGPVCDGEIYWWKVDYDGLIGWTAEGKNNAYWVVPIASTPKPTATTTFTPTATATHTPTATATPVPINLELVAEIDNRSTVIDLEFSSDGSMIALVLALARIQILDAQTLEILMNIDLEDDENLPDNPNITDISWHPDGQQVAVSLSEKGLFRVYSVPDGNILWEKEMAHYFLYTDNDGIQELSQQPVRVAQFTPDGEQLLTLGWILDKGKKTEENLSISSTIINCISTEIRLIVVVSYPV